MLSLFAEGTLTTSEGLGLSTIVAAVVGFVTWGLPKLMDWRKLNREAAVADHATHRREELEDEEREDNKWKVYAERLNEERKDAIKRYDDLRTEMHEQYNNANDRINKFQVLVVSLYNHTQYLEEILDDKNIKHKKWTPPDSSVNIILPPPPPGESK